MDFYELHLAGLVRRLPKVAISKNLSIASFVMMGDTELVERCAEKLTERLRDISLDALVCPEAKAIPLTHAMARIMKLNYVVIRKSVKGYMVGPLVETVRSITTTEEQTLVMDGSDVAKIRGRKVCLVDDVVSTGASLRSARQILDRAGAITVAQAAPLLEEGGHDGEGVTFLETLPVFPTEK
ncbi:MAG: phosphoribosyltransferase family protein [Synergistota bacterium]|nr:phosphoribosyltransferase family protein [Synergistota bacterium]